MSSKFHSLLPLIVLSAMALGLGGCSDSVTNTDSDSGTDPGGDPVVGKTYYVAPSDHPTTPGDDERSAEQAQQLATPWASLQRAADEVGPGDQVLVRGGTYVAEGPLATPVVNLITSGTSEAPIYFGSYENEEVILDAVGHQNAFMVGIAASRDRTYQGVGVSYVTIEDFVCTGAVNEPFPFNTASTELVEVDLAFESSWSIRQKYDFLKDQLEQIFALRSGSACEDAGTIVTYTDPASGTEVTLSYDGDAPDMGPGEN